MKCLVCNKGKNVLEFNKTSLKKCLLMLLYRRKKQHKHHDLLSKVESTENFGYHSDCLKKITVLRHKDKEEFEDFCKTVPSIPSDLDGRNPSAMTCDVVVKEEPDTDTPCYQTATVFINEHKDDDIYSSNELFIEMKPLQVSSKTKARKSVCIFCDHIQKRVGKRKINVVFPKSDATVEKLKIIAKKSNDTKLLGRLEDRESIAYHSNCFSFYLVSWKRQNQERPEPGFWHKNRELHQLAFNAISDIIYSEVIIKNRVLYLTDLLTQYKALLLEFGEGQVTAEDVQEYRVANLESKVTSAFGGIISVGSSTGVRRKKIIYQCDMDSSKLAEEIAILESNKRKRFTDVAYELRSCIKTLDSTNLPDDETVEDVNLVDSKIPEKLLNFVTDLVHGPDTRRETSDEDLVKIKSVCNDLVNIVSQGRVKKKDETSCPEVGNEVNDKVEQTSNNVE